MSIISRRNDHFKFDICLSFAEEDRKYVDRVAKELTNRGIVIFYDQYQNVETWGKDLYEHLDKVYREEARYCLMFISKHYARKAWASHERRSAQARALQQFQDDYILPVRFDKTKLPGLRPTIKYLDLKNISAKKLALIVAGKIIHSKSEFIPPSLDLFYSELKIKKKLDKNSAHKRFSRIYFNLRNLNDLERKVIFLIFLNGCPSDLPENIHIESKHLERLSKISKNNLEKILKNISSEGFFFHKNSVPEHGETLFIEYHCLEASNPGNATGIFSILVSAASKNFCGEHALEKLIKLNFMQLCSLTSSLGCSDKDDEIDLTI
jgi:hypothetical protein